MPVPDPLPLPILLRRPRMALAIVLLILRMSIAPLPLTVADHFGVLGVGLDLGAMVDGPSLALAVRLAAHGLIRPELGWLEGLLTVTAGTKHQSFSPGLFQRQSLEKNRSFRARYRNCYRVPTASPPMGALLVLWLRPVPAEMAPFFTGPNK